MENSNIFLLSNDKGKQEFRYLHTIAKDRSAVQKNRYIALSISELCYIIGGFDIMTLCIYLWRTQKHHLKEEFTKKMNC